MPNLWGSKWIRPEKRRRIYERDAYRCLWCWAYLGNVVPADRTLDHFTPRARGGSNDASNLFTACITCNSLRGFATVAEFAAQRAFDQCRRLGVDPREMQRGIQAAIIGRIYLAVRTPLLAA